MKPRLISIELRATFLLDHGSEMGRLTTIGGSTVDEAVAMLRERIAQWERRAEEASSDHALLEGMKKPRVFRLPPRRT